MFDILLFLIHRISPRKEPCYQNPEEPEEEDEDVQMERAKIRHAIASQHEGEVKLALVLFCPCVYQHVRVSSAEIHPGKIISTSIGSPVISSLFSPYSCESKLTF